MLDAYYAWHGGKNALESSALTSSYPQIFSSGTWHHTMYNVYHDIASNMVIAIVFYAISLSLMVNIIHTHIYKLPEWWTLKLLLMANIIHTQICKLPDCWILKWSQYDDLICHSWFKWYFHFTAATNETWFFFFWPGLPVCWLKVPVGIAFFIGRMTFNIKNWIKWTCSHHLHHFGMLKVSNYFSFWLWYIIRYYT